MTPIEARDQIVGFNSNPPGSAVDWLRTGAIGMRKVKKGLFGSQYVEFDDRRPQLEGWALVKWVDQQKRSLDNPTDYEDSWHELWLSSSYALIRAHVWRRTQFRQGSGRPTETYGAITNTATDSDLDGHAPTLGTSDVARLVTRELDQNRSGFSRRISRE